MQSGDKEDIIRLIKLFFDEKLTEIGCKYSREAAERDFKKFKTAIRTFVYEKDGKVVGFIGGVVSEKLFSDGLTLQEIGWFVDPAYRRCGIKLLKAFEQYGRNMGCDDIIMIGLEGDKSNSFYKKFGYKEIQTTYRKKIGD